MKNFFLKNATENTKETKNGSFATAKYYKIPIEYTSKTYY